MEENMRKIFSLLLIALFAVTINAQTVTLETYGVNPRQVAADSTDIFDFKSNGSTNVGKETQMYLKGSSDVALTAASWTLDSKPVGSTTVLGTAEVADTSTEFMVFTPDSVGTYVVIFADGGMADTLTINAGLYLGVETGTPNCVMCHNGTYNKWAGTAHAIATKKQLDAMEGSTPFFGESCLECHATGYNPNAVNDGFDDWPFTFPSTKEPGMYDSLKTEYPDAMARADVQCEGCHGPGSEHNGAVTDSKMVSTLDSENCASCHEDNGTHHFFPSQWAGSGHANPPGYPGGGRTSCRGCHNGAQFIQYVNGEEITAQPASLNPITCAVCHDPHSVEHESQVRTVVATLSNGEEVVDGGTGALCMNCHQSRRDGETYPVTGSGSHYGPHYVPQADMLVGTNASTFGYDLPTSPHFQDVGNTCVGCHMLEGHMDAADSDIPAGGHTFSVLNNDGSDNVEVCTDCHGEVGTTFDEKKYYFNGNADHDGDGMAEGLTHEVEGLMFELAALLPHADSVDGYDPHDTVDDSFTLNEKRAAFNYELVYYDHSHGIHNPAYTVALLKVSIEALKYGGLDAGIIQQVTDVPMDQGLQVRIVWTAFSSAEYDQIDSYIIKRQVPDSVDLWEDVAVVPAVQYVEYAAVVPTLYNDVEATFKVVGVTEGMDVAETEPMSGTSTDDLAPEAPSNAIAALENTEVVVTWDESPDKDFNYFEIFRSETQGFAPALENRIATTTDIQISDAAVEDGKTYFYLVTARDFSENQSDASNEVNVTITAVDDTRMTPTEYSLDQNYPNPFNPSTTVTFGIPENADVQVTIYDMVGNKVEVLVNDNLSAGYHTYSWNAANHASGIYFCQMTTGKFTSVNKMLLIK